MWQQNTDTAWNRMMLHVDVTLLLTDITQLPVHTCTWCYVTCLYQPLWIWPISIQLTVIYERMEYGIVQIINLHRPTSQILLEDSKLEASKRQRPRDRTLDQRISRSNSNTTALHSVYTIKHKKGNIEIFWKLNHNIHNWLFYGVFAFLVHFAAKIYNTWDFHEYLIKILQFLELLQTSCYLQTILERMWNIWKYQVNSWDLASLIPTQYVNLVFFLNTFLKYWQNLWLYYLLYVW